MNQSTNKPPVKKMIRTVPRLLYPATPPVPLPSSFIPIRAVQSQGGNKERLTGSQRLTPYAGRNANQNAIPDAYASVVRASNFMSQVDSGVNSLAKSLDSAFKAYGETVQADLKDFRMLCADITMKEQQERRQWQTLCVKVMRERDVERQKMRQILSTQRSADPVTGPSTSIFTTADLLRTPSNTVRSPSACSITSSSPRFSKRGREEPNAQTSAGKGNEEHPEVALPILPNDRPMISLRASPTVSSPPSPAAVVNQSVANSSSAMASLSLASGTSRCSPDPDEARDQGLSAPSDEQPPPLKRRKSSEYSALSPSSSCSEDTLVASPTEDLSGSKKIEAISTGKGTKTRSSQCSAQKPKSAPSSPPSKPTAQLDFSHVDIMYYHANGRLVCRACVLTAEKVTSEVEPQSFPSNASWDELRDHCFAEHITACNDVARLHPADLFELRRRLTM